MSCPNRLVSCQLNEILHQQYTAYKDSIHICFFMFIYARTTNPYGCLAQYDYDN